MLLVTADEARHISRPLVDFGSRQPVGVGDVTSGLLLVKLLQGASLRDALEHVTAAVYEIMLATKKICRSMNCRWWRHRTASPNRSITSALRSYKRDGMPACGHANGFTSDLLPTAPPQRTDAPRHAPSVRQYLRTLPYSVSPHSPSAVP